MVFRYQKLKKIIDRVIFGEQSLQLMTDVCKVHRD